MPHEYRKTFGNDIPSIRTLQTLIEAGWAKGEYNPSLILICAGVDKTGAGQLRQSLSEASTNIYTDEKRVHENGSGQPRSIHSSPLLDSGARQCSASRLTLDVWSMTSISRSRHMYILWLNMWKSILDVHVPRILIQHHHVESVIVHLSTFSMKGIVVPSLGLNISSLNRSIFSSSTPAINRRQLSRITPRVR